ncbi:uncharacterized protein BJ212DRAFT_1303748 [Suillus subaureus]|uniref:Uncharacterized protein n=1 Tax=Suillus subaureus TaxID=48587 RepID=A0A9P7J737_9AGAM|nr:uncharacterized protein BJ212DRAFT_1303748 [Suillus subaureus]KAG1806084.1 hypothetical protein BJ212DRAFT_1303748 [Suillus subaureus]
MSPSPDLNGSSDSDNMISPSLDPFFQQRLVNAPLMQQEHAPMGGNGLLSAYMCLKEQVKASLKSLTLTLDPANLSTFSPQSLPVTLKVKEITVPSYHRADFLSEFIWTKEDWKKCQEKPSTQLEKSHLLHYIIDKNNKPIPLECVTAIHTTSQQVFVDIWNIKEAPKSWGAASGSTSKLYYQEMVTFFPKLGYCNGNWKYDAIATASYTSWHKNHINHLALEGTYKPTAEDIIDFNNLETLDSDDTDSATGDVKPQKWTHDSDPLSITSTSSKKQKSLEISIPEHRSPSPLHLDLDDMDLTSDLLKLDENTPMAESQPTELGHSDNIQVSITDITKPASSSNKTPASRYLFVVPCMAIEICKPACGSTVLDSTFPLRRYDTDSVYSPSGGTDIHAADQ